VETLSGEKVDEHSTRESNDAAAATKMSNVRSTSYMISDSFEKEATFDNALPKSILYRGLRGRRGKNRISQRPRIGGES